MDITNSKNLKKLSKEAKKTLSDIDKFLLLAKVQRIALGSKSYNAIVEQFSGLDKERIKEKFFYKNIEIYRINFL